MIRHKLAKGSTSTGSTITNRSGEIVTAFRPYADQEPWVQIIGKDKTEIEPFVSDLLRSIRSQSDGKSLDPIWDTVIKLKEAVLAFDGQGMSGLNIIKAIIDTLQALDSVSENEEDNNQFNFTDPTSPNTFRHHTIGMDINVIRDLASVIGESFDFNPQEYIQIEQTCCNFFKIEYEHAAESEDLP